MSTKVCRPLREAVISEQRGVTLNKLSPCWLLSWVVAHTFGIRLIYPGLLVGPMLRAYLEDSRAKMIVQMKGVRTKIVTADGNWIDTMFFDRRR